MEPKEPIESTDPQAQLAQAFIDEYLQSQGQSMETLCQLPEQEFKQLMTRASIYASTKLAELENRAHLLSQIHGSATGSGETM